MAFIIYNMYRRQEPPTCRLPEQATQQRDQSRANQSDTATGHQLLHALRLRAGVVITISFQQVDDTPNAKARTQSDNEGLKHFDSRVKEIHSRFLQKDLAAGRHTPEIIILLAANRSRVDLLVCLGPGKENPSRVGRLNKCIAELSFGVNDHCS